MLDGGDLLASTDLAEAVVQRATNSIVPTELDNDENEKEEKDLAELNGTKEESGIAQPDSNPCSQNVTSIRYEELTLDVVAPNGEKFENLNISKPILDGLEFIGYKYPSPIQVKAIPPGLTGRDLIVQSKAGTGKTCVFVVVALELVNTATSSALQVLVITVTPEVCFQVYEAFRKIGHFKKGLKCFYTVGGTLLRQDINNLKESQIVIGTIGRLCHLIKNGYMSVDSVKLLVLDELDKLQEESVIDNFNWIFHHLRPNKQIVTASATYPIAFRQCLFPYMRNPYIVQLSLNEDHLLGVKEYVMINMKRDVCIWETRMDALAYLLKEVDYDQCIVFTNFQTRVEQIAGDLEKRDVKAQTVTGTMSLQQRMGVIRQLIREKYRLIVTTDVYSRGLDLPHANLVINVEVPINWESYVHRIGRAGRFGRQAAAVTLVCQHRDSDEFFAMAQGCFSFFKIIPKRAPKDLVSNVDFYNECQSCAFDNVTPAVLWLMLRNFNALLELNPVKGGNGVKHNDLGASTKKPINSTGQKKRDGEYSTVAAEKGGKDEQETLANDPCMSSGYNEGQRRPQGGFKAAKNKTSGWQANAPMEKTQFLLEYIKMKQSEKSTPLDVEAQKLRRYDSRIFCEILQHCLKEEPPANPEVSALMASIPKRVPFHSIKSSRKDSESRQSDTPSDKERMEEDYHSSVHMEGAYPTNNSTNSETLKPNDVEKTEASMPQCEPISNTANRVASVEVFYNFTRPSNSTVKVVEQNSAARFTYLQDENGETLVLPEAPISSAQLSVLQLVGNVDLLADKLRDTVVVSRKEHTSLSTPTEAKETPVEDVAVGLNAYSLGESKKVNLEDRRLFAAAHVLLLLQFQVDQEANLQHVQVGGAAVPVLSAAAMVDAGTADRKDNAERSSTMETPLVVDVDKAKETVQANISSANEQIDEGNASSALQEQLLCRKHYVEHMLAFRRTLS
ncbi:DEAD/DEAH box helicase [Trichuris suis]|nr:DEAD/DEAH box helicase [Trichuris suis]